MKIVITVTIDILTTGTLNTRNEQNFGDISNL